MIRLTPQGPYSWALSLKRLQDMPRQVITRTEPGSVYVRAVDHDGHLGSVRVEEADGDLVLTIKGELDPERTVRQVRSAFSLDLDHAAFLDHMAVTDPVITGLAQRYRGARPIASFDLWEALAWTVIAQQVNMTFAYTMKEALVRLGGRSYDGMPAFPGPERVAALRYEDLQAEKYSRKKAEYVIDLARAIALGDLNLRAIVQLPFDSAVAALVKLRGVGRWTAECLLMEAGAPDAFPADDIGIRNAVRRFYGLDHQPKGSEVRELGRAWAPYSALACYYLWLGLLDKESVVD